MVIKPEASLATWVHECVHVADFIMDHIGTPTDASNTGLRAYFVGHLFKALHDAGFSVTLNRKGVKSGFDYDSIFGPGTAHPLTGMHDMLGLSRIDGTLIKAGDLCLMCAADGLRLTGADRVTVQGVSYAVVLCEPFAPTGVSLYYDLVLRA